MSWSPGTIGERRIALSWLSFPARWADRDQRAPANQLPALVEDGDIGSGHGVGPRPDEMFPVASRLAGLLWT